MSTEAIDADFTGSSFSLGMDELSMLHQSLDDYVFLASLLHDLVISFFCLGLTDVGPLSP